MIDEVISENDILSKNEEVRSSRIQRIRDEMYNPENLEFISRKNVDYCIICEKNDKKYVQMNNPGEYFHHLCNFHGECREDFILFLLEKIVDAVLFLKRMNATSSGEFSN